MAELAEHWKRKPSQKVWALRGIARRTCKIPLNLDTTFLMGNAVQRKIKCNVEQLRMCLLQGWPICPRPRWCTWTQLHARRWTLLYKAQGLCHSLLGPLGVSMVWCLHKEPLWLWTCQVPVACRWPRLFGTQQSCPKHSPDRQFQVCPRRSVYDQMRNEEEGNVPCLLGLFWLFFLDRSYCLERHTAVAVDPH